jgi:hypothetical protein
VTPARSATWIIPTLFLALLIALVAYYLPWVDHITAGFTMNGFDLAEWSSLHPAVRASSPPMLASFLLRVPQVAVAIGLALAASALRDPRWRAVGWAAALLVAVRFIPPAEFVQSARSDPNYRQMALLTALGVLGVGVAAFLSRRGDRWLVAGAALLTILGAVAGWIGLARAGELLDNFEIAVRTGSGPVLYTIAAVMAGLLAVWDVRRGRGIKKGD